MPLCLFTMSVHEQNSERFQFQNCTPSNTLPGDIIDNDCDGSIDEELRDGKGKRNLT